MNNECPSCGKPTLGLTEVVLTEKYGKVDPHEFRGAICGHCAAILAYRLRVFLRDFKIEEVR